MSSYFHLYRLHFGSYNFFRWEYVCIRLVNISLLIRFVLSLSIFQALIGSVAYDTAIEKDSSEQHKVWGMQILTIAVLCILITAPVGAAGMSIAGPRLLQMTKKTDDR